MDKKLDAQQNKRKILLVFKMVREWDLTILECNLSLSFLYTKFSIKRSVVYNITNVGILPSKQISPSASEIAGVSAEENQNHIIKLERERERAMCLGLVDVPENIP